MTDYSRGGVVVGDPTVQIRVVDYPSTRRLDADGLVLYSDECIISKDSVCTRMDDLHAEAPKAPGSRWWACPLHDNRRTGVSSLPTGIYAR